jgi:hypothetical protein
MQRALLVFYLLTIFFQSFSQKHNQYRKGERHGTWIVYQDSTEKLIDNIGRYRKGIPKGTWRYYDNNGVLIKKEKHFLRKTNIEFYHPNGAIKKKGKAKTVVSKSLIHYYYFGKWYVFDEKGKQIKEQFYKEGYKVSEKNLVVTSGLNDSLIRILRKMNNDFFIYTDSISLAENAKGKTSKEYHRYVSLSNLNALKTLEELDIIINKFGYPGRSLVGEEYAIAFSLISSSNIKFKEKYYDLIVNAANANELDWSDVVFFVDKVKVARKEKQIYATQFRLNAEGTAMIYYPIADKMNLNERRKEKGLPELDPASLDDNAKYD